MNVIKEIFRDNRDMKKIKDNLYKTENNEIVLLKENSGNFTTKRLANIICDAEDLYEEYNTKINVYILQDKDGKIKVHERMIQSEADFTIKLAHSIFERKNDYEVLQEIADKIHNNNYSKEDIKKLEKLPIECNKENRRGIRKLVLDLLEEIE